MSRNSTATSAADCKDKACCEAKGGKWVSSAGICKEPDIGKKLEPIRVMPAFFVPPDESAPPQET